MRAKLIHEIGGERTFVAVFETGDEAFALLSEFVKTERVSGAHFTGIGALSAATLGFFDLEQKTYRRIPVAEQVEVVSLVGNVALDGGQPKVHAHMIVARADGSAMGGHLLEARVRPTLEVVIVESPTHLRRKLDERTGLALLDIT
jgi:uncharacterized protein